MLTRSASCSAGRDYYITCFHSGYLLSGFDETFETFCYALTDLLRHVVCEMDTSMCEMDTSNKHQASLWCAVVLSHIDKTYGLS